MAVEMGMPVIEAGPANLRSGGAGSPLRAGLATLIIPGHSYPLDKPNGVPSTRYDIGRMDRVQTYSGPPL